MDDTHTVQKKAHAQEFTDHLNSIDECIKWTTEGEILTEFPTETDDEHDTNVERALAFLDTLTVVKSDGSVKTKVYRKETHTDQYLNFESNHPLEHKMGVVRTLMHRADSVVTDPEDLAKEKDHLRRALGVNGYPDS